MNGMIIDKEKLLSSLNNNLDALWEIGDIFLEEFPVFVAKIHIAIKRKDAETLRDAAHALKGAAMNIAAHSASIAAQKLEIFAWDEDFEQAEAALNLLLKELEKVRCELKMMGVEPAHVE